MAITHLKYLDEFAPWITKMNYTDGKWNVVLHPGHTIVAKSIVSVVEMMLKHVMHETIQLSCEALNTEIKYLKVRTRERLVADNRQAIANVLLDRFDYKISYQVMARSLGWNSHCMMSHARNNAGVKEINVKINKIYSRYPFLKDGYNSLR